MQCYRQNCSEIFHWGKIFHCVWWNKLLLSIVCYRIIIDNLWMWHHQNQCNYSLVDQKFWKVSAKRATWFGYMPKTNQIAAKVYRTSLDRKIEDLKPGSACPADKKLFFSQKIDLNKRHNVNIKVKNSFAFLYRKTEFCKRCIDFRVIQVWSFRKKRSGGLKTKTNIASLFFIEPAIIIETSDRTWCPPAFEYLMIP